MVSLTAKDSWLIGRDAFVTDYFYPHTRYDPQQSSTAHLFENATFKTDSEASVLGAVVADNLTFGHNPHSHSLYIAEQGFGVAGFESYYLGQIAQSPASGLLGLSPASGLSPNNLTLVWSNLRGQLRENVLSIWVQP
jgi:Eukaryotic aspartyl protease